MLRLHVREEPLQDDSGQDRKPGRPRASQRAVFELEFDRLGRCQIDVLCRAERFGLIVRTEEALAPQLCREVRDLYVAARDAAGLLGDVRFRAGEWILLPEPGEAARAGAGITV